jgi:hypothetical protein
MAASGSLPCAVSSAPHRSVSLDECCCSWICRLGGAARFVGIFYVDDARTLSKSLILFTSPATGTTLACRFPELSAENVRNTIRKSDRLFDAANLAGVPL